MRFISLNPAESKCLCQERDIFTVFKQNQEKTEEIHEDMTPDEISDVVSNHLMEVIRKQFEAAKTEYRAKVNK